MASLDGFTIAIAGLGLMGGSLAMALKRSGAAVTVLGADTNAATLDRAQMLGIVDGFCADFAPTRGRHTPAKCFYLPM